MSSPDDVQRRALLLALGAACIPAQRTVAAEPDNGRTPYPARAEVQAYIDELVATQGFDRAQVERWLKGARYSAQVERLMQPAIPFGQRNWLEYRARYLDPVRVQGGLAFWKQHAKTLARAQTEMGVPAEIIVAIIGIETLYGRTTGSFRTLDALATLSFDYLRRADYYRGELTELLLLAREQRVDPASYRGSFAGALGLPQFMPGSIRRWAVDFDGDGRIDLLASPADAIGSVASFLVAHGWQRDLPIAFTVDASEEIVDRLGRGIRAETTWSSVLAEGVTDDALLPLDTPVIVIDLPLLNPDGSPGREFRVGTVNFSALLHYNRSYFYAAAVMDLAATLRERMPTS